MNNSRQLSGFRIPFVSYQSSDPMSMVFAELETVTQSERFVPRTSATRATLLHCLVVAEDAERREFLSASAKVAGWEVAAYADANAASVAASRWRHVLAIVDLDGLEPGSASNIRSFTESLSASSAPLLMICGTEGNPLEEIWARQLGVWLYLSGVDPRCDLSSLCHEAKQVAQKLNPEPAYARTA